MNRLVIIFIMSFLFIGGCDDTKDSLEVLLRPTDRLSQSEILENDFELNTPVYNIQVEIDPRISKLNHGSLLMAIDMEVAKTYSCLFMDADEFPFTEHTVVYDDCRNFQPNRTRLSIENLKVYINKNRFFCFTTVNEHNSDKCWGNYLQGRNIDIIVISRDLKFFGHEVAHREGMCSDHSNESDFTHCENIAPTGLSIRE